MIRQAAVLLLGLVAGGPDARAATSDTPLPQFDERACELTEVIVRNFALPSGLFAESRTKRRPDFMWGNGITFPALLAAARHDPKYRPIVSRYFTAMDAYWDKKSKVAGYEPLPTRGNGNDKYYDDNAWMAIAFVEAYELTGDERQLQRAEESLAFVMSGWDEQRGGGIWWHEGHKDGTKNTCANAPTAVACLKLAKHRPQRAKELIATAKKIVDWTAETFESPDGLFADRINVETGKVVRDQLTYNTALMIRAYLGLAQATGDETYLARAKRSAKAADWFTDAKTGAFRDEVKFAHLLVEADLELYRATGEKYLADRAVANAKHQYDTWKRQPSAELIDIASVARTLWLTHEALEGSR